MELCLKDAQANIRKSVEMKGSNSIVPWSSSVSIKSGPDTRRNNKPLMEKRRRARINQSVALLKNILLASRQDVIADKPQKQAKLEKADILEMTVRHFQMTRAFDKNDVDKYRSGYTDCIREVERFFNTPDVHTRILPELADLDLKVKLLRHLESCISEIDSKKTSDDELPQSQIADNTNSYGLKTSDINSINAFEEQMAKDHVRNMVSQNQSEKENLFIGSEENEIEFSLDLDEESVKQEENENSLSQQSIIQSINISECSQKLPEPIFSINGFENNTMLSMMPSITMPGQVVFLVPTNVFGISNFNTSHFLTPFIPTISEHENSVFEQPVQQMEVCNTTYGHIAEQTNENDSESTDKKLDEKNSDNESCELPSDSRDNSNEEPLDFSMSSDMAQNDPMWRPW